MHTLRYRKDTKLTHAHTIPTWGPSGFFLLCHHPLFCMSCPGLRNVTVFSLFLYFLWVMARRSVDILLCGDWQTCSTISHWLKALSKSSGWLMFTCLYEALFPALVTIRDGSFQESQTVSALKSNTSKKFRLVKHWKTNGSVLTWLQPLLLKFACGPRIPWKLFMFRFIGD